MKLLYLCLEMSSDSKNYFGCVVDGIFSRAHIFFSSIRTSNFLAEAEPGLNVLIFLAI